MPERIKPTDEQMKRLLENVKERHDGYLREWLKIPEFRATLHRHDRKRTGDEADDAGTR